MRRIRTASIATLGCKLNQSESEAMSRQLSEAGVALVPFGWPADLCVVNSCTVTHVGDRKSRQLIRQAVRSSPGAFVVVVGCYAEMEPEAVAAVEGVDAVLGNRDTDRLVDILRDRGLEVGEDTSPFGRGRPSAAMAGEGPHPRPSPIAVGEIVGKPGLTPRPPRPRGEGESHGRTRAFVKIQEGCDNYCSYCIVPYARGHGRSRPADEVVEEIRRLVSEGYQEVVLTGVNITAYGRDHGSRSVGRDERGLGLLKLVERILVETDLPRLRLSSLQPEDWTPRFYAIWDSGRLCRHLHLSLQSGSDTVLKRMHRRYNANQYADVVAEARMALPGVAITTDVIVGFPGETETEYRETESFLRSIDPAGFHVFKYSPRAGTAAAKMDGQVDPRTKQQRSDRLIRLARECGRRFRSRFVGEVLGVLWEGCLPDPEARELGLDSSSPWWSGLSDNYIRVYAASPDGLAGSVTGVRVDRLAGEGVVATLLR